MGGTLARRDRRAAARKRTGGIRIGRARTLAPLAVFVLAFLLRLIYVLQQSQANPQFDAPLMDPEYHDQWAWSLAQGTWDAQGPFFRAPLYPLFLAAIYSLAGHDYLFARLVQAFVGSLSCVLVYLIGERLFSRTVGLLAGIGAALSWILIFFDNELLIEGLYVALILGFFYTLIRALEGRLWNVKALPARPEVWGAISGALFGLAAIARPNVLVFLPALIWAFVRGLRRGLPRFAVLLFAVLAIIPIGVVTLYNATAGGDFVIIASQGGVNFYIGNNPESDGHTAVVPGTRGDWWGGRFDTIKIAEEAAGRDLKDSEVSSYWFRRGLAFMAAHPFAWIGLTARKLALFWSAPEIGNNESVYHLRAYAPLMKLPLLGFGLIAPLAAAGIYLTMRRSRIAGAPAAGASPKSSPAAGASLESSRERATLPLAFIVLYVAGVVAFFVCARFRVPVIPFLLLFAALAIERVVSLWKSGTRRPIAIASALFVVAAIAVNVPSLSHHENIALARYHDSLAWSKKGDLARAEAALRDALRIDPNLAVARTNLANVLAARGAGSQVLAEYERVLAANPRSAKAYANLASYHLDAGNLAAAESVVVEGLAIDPDCSPALRVLGVIKERRGDLAGARDAYTRGLRFPEEAHRLENNLGVVEIKMGEIAEAETHLRRSVELDPTYAMAWGNLGRLLAGSDRLEQSVEPLTRAANLESNRPERWMELAQVLQQLGRTQDARSAERRAAALHESAGTQRP